MARVSLRRSESRDPRRRRRRVPGRARATQRVRARRRGGRGRRAASARLAARAARRHQSSGTRTGRRARTRGRRGTRLHVVGARGLGRHAGSGGRMDRGAGVNAAELQILGSRLASVADEMGAVLRRAASSPNIKERADCSAAVFTASGELLAQAEHIPVHLGSMPASVAAAIATGLHVELMLNDPFAGGTHLNDLTMVAPVLVDGALVGWVANRAHHADVGGTAPGSMPPDALTVDEEGLRLPPVPVDDRSLVRVIASSRTPDERRGDLDAQRGANRLGVRRLSELVRAMGGVASSEELFAEILDYGERRMRAVLRDFSDGRFAASDVLDSAGPRPEQQRPIHVVVEVRIVDEDITFDFTGTDAQRPGNVNAVEAVTVSAVAFAIRAVTDPTLPANGGTLRPVHVVAPAGTVVAAVPPVAVGAGNVEVSQRVADVCLAALAQARPERVGAAG